MSRRRVTETVKCAKSGCTEYAHYEYSSQRERAESAKFRQKHPYRCVRHHDEDEVLSPESVERVGVLTAEKRFYRSHDGTEKPLDGLSWRADGSASGSGFVHGPGFKAFAKDFPEGTRLIVTARVELPGDPS